MRRLLLGTFTFALAGALGGCAAIDDYLHPRVEVADTAPPSAAAVAPPRSPMNGSIYQAGNFRPMFEDFRARLVGDTLTIQIVENVSATATSTSSVAKTGTLGGGVSALPILGTSALARASVSGNSNNTFSGQGATVNSNAFTGTITVIVRQVLPNGNLLIAGEKQIGVNENVDMLRFSGQVDPRAIQQGNTVPSGSVANVRLEQRGRGQQAESQAMGWLSRVFQNVAPI